MLRLNLDKWGQTQEDLLRLAHSSEHQRTRERFLLLYNMVTRGIAATALAKEMGRYHQTGMAWVHTYNESGPEAIKYHRTGGRRPLFLNHRPRV